MCVPRFESLACFAALLALAGTDTDASSPALRFELWLNSPGLDGFYFSTDFPTLPLSDRAIKGLVCKREEIQARQEQSSDDPERSSPDYKESEIVAMVLCF
jgi:hypothetical protein